MFALFEDVMLSCCETAGYVRFAIFTSGYGYSLFLFFSLPIFSLPLLLSLRLIFFY